MPKSGAKTLLEVKATQTSIIHLEITITRIQAEWLKSLVQNPIGIRPVEESQEISTLRYTLFSRLKDSLSNA